MQPGDSDSIKQALDRDDRDARGLIRRYWWSGALAIGAVSLFFAQPRTGAEPAEVPVIFVPTPPPVSVTLDTLRSGQTLGEMFTAGGFTPGEIHQLVGEISEHLSVRRLRPGVVVGVFAHPGEPTHRISIQPDADQVLHLTAAGDTWESMIDSVPVTVDTVLIGGVIQTSLYEAELTGDVDRLAPREDIEIVWELTRLFAWQVDFHRDLRVGDGFRVAIRREVRPDGSVRPGAQVLAAEFINQGRMYTAVRFVDPNGKAEYYDRDGESLQRMFLRAPLEFARVTSRFNPRRFHPVLRRRTAHLGTDYSARTGTPVLTVGNGTVTRAGTWGGYGRIVEIRHNSTYTTRYAHLSGFGRGVRVGSRVQQGQVIGYSGSTGLVSAPHLHYEFLKNGRQTDPRLLKLPPGRAVAESLRLQFELQRDEVVPVLDALVVPDIFEEPTRVVEADLKSSAS